MAQVQWIKLSTGMFTTSRKIRQIEQMPDRDTILVIWLKLMLLAGQVNDGGKVYITPEIPYTEEELAFELARPLADVQNALRVFERFGMIRNERGVLRLTSWEKYQNIETMDKIREQTKERVAKHREKRRAGACNATCNVTVTHGNATEEEREEEGEKEEEKESKNVQSDAHSLFPDLIDSESDPESAAQAERSRRRFLGGNLGRGVVLLSEEQMDSLLEVLSAEEFDHYVSVIAENELKGNHYKRRTHYQAILDMAKIDRKI